MTSTLDCQPDDAETKLYRIHFYNKQLTQQQACAMPLAGDTIDPLS